MRKILLIIIPLLIIAKLSIGATDLRVIAVTSPLSGCPLTSNEHVIVNIKNVGTTDLSGVTFDLTFILDNGAPVTDFGISIPVLPINTTVAYTFTVGANVSTPGLHTFKVYSANLSGDNNQTNDTTNTSVTNTGSVGGIVTSSDTVCAGINGNTLTLSGYTGAIQHWESSPDGVNWTNIGHGGLTTDTYLNLLDTTYYRVIVKNGGCDADSSTPAKITVTPIPALTSNLFTGTCSGGLFAYNPVSTISGSTFTWVRNAVNHITPISSSGSGNISEVLSNDTSIFINTIYRITTTANGCSNAGENVTVRVDRYLPGPANPISGATRVCQGTVHGYSTVSLNPDTTAWYTWSYLVGTGVGFSNNSNITAASYSATATSGNMFVVGSNYCGNGPPSPVYTIQVDTAELAFAGNFDSICQSSSPSPYILAGATLGGPAATVGTWSVMTGGAGTLNLTTATDRPDTVTFTPTANFVGTVILRLTTNNPPTTCGSVFSDRIIRIDTAAVIITGGPDSVCQSSTPATFFLTGSSVAGPAGIMAAWSILSGGGILSSIADTVRPDSIMYTPVANYTGIVTLQLTSTNPGTACGSIFAIRTIQVLPFVTVAAGSDTSICAGNSYTLAGSIGGGATSSTWTTLGDGSFNDSSLVNAMYTPGANDISSGMATLVISTNDPAGPCSYVTDTMILTINPPATASANIDDTICAGSTYTLSGSIGGSATSSTWTTSGDGTFNDSSLVNATYTAGTNDRTNGTVFLIITSNDPVGICAAVVDTMILTIQPPVIVSAGNDSSVCKGNAFTLSGLMAGGAISVTWTTLGDGAFNDSSLVNAIYTPGTNDTSNGTVTLILTTNDPAGPCIAIADSMILTIDTPATVIAGGPDNICDASSPSPFVLTGASVGGSATTGAWSIVTGSGTLSNTTQQNNAGIAATTYTPAANTVEVVTLRLTTNNPGTACGAVFADRTLTINTKPAVVTTDPAAVCAPLTVDLTVPAVTAGSTAGLTFNYYTNASATIHPADSSAITVSGTYYITGINGSGCSDTTGVNVVVNLSAIGGTVGNDAIVCPGSNGDTLTLTGYVGAIQKWQSSIDGGLSWVDIVDATPQYYYSNLITTTWYRVVMSAFCSSATSVEARITVDSHPTPIGGVVTPNDTVCSGFNNDTLTLNGYTGNVTRWEYSIDGGNTWVYINNTTNIQIFNNITTTTIYHAVVQNGACGSATSTNDTVTVTPPTNPGSITGATVGCAGSNSGTLTLTGYTGSVIKWQYSTDAGATWTDSTNTTATQVYGNLPDTTLYRVFVKNGTCPVDSSSATTVIVYPKPVAAFTADTVCTGGTTIFTNTSAVSAGFIQFNQWDFGDNTASLAVNPTHAYALGIHTATLITTTNYGCADTAVVSILVKTKPNAQITSIGSLSFCCGGSVTLSGAAGLNYLWNDATASTSQSISVSNCAASGVYQLKVTDPATSCTDSSSVTVVILPLPVANAGNDTTITLGNSLTLNGQGGLTYLWTPAAGLSNPNIANPIATPTATTTIELTVTGANGCSDNDSITIIVIDNMNIVITTLITANGDGYNDKWIVKNIENYPGTEVTIINREGQEVYHSSAYDNSWEGTGKNGKSLPDGTYYYFIKFKNNDKVYKGPITILNEK